MRPTINSFVSSSQQIGKLETILIVKLEKTKIRIKKKIFFLAIIFNKEYKIKITEKDIKKIGKVK